MTDEDRESLRSLIVLLKQSKVSQFAGHGVKIVFSPTAYDEQQPRHEVRPPKEDTETPWASGGLIPKTRAELLKG